jgi:hypothetical protein
MWFISGQFFSLKIDASTGTQPEYKLRICFNPKNVGPSPLYEIYQWLTIIFKNYVMNRVNIT